MIKHCQLSDGLVDRMLGAIVPGGSQARDWFLPHETERGLANVRDTVRCMVEALVRESGGSAEEVDLVARGMGWDQTVSMIREAFEQAGVPWTDESGKEPKAIVINIMQRLANSAHKAGFRLALERSAAAAAAAAVSTSEPSCSR